MAHSFCESRNKAQSLIKEGLVFVNGTKILKSSFEVKESDTLSITQHKEYVSRAAFKLLDFLERLSLDLHNRVALDIGSSTGGFTQVLLEKGVKEVYCVDVGSQQLHHSLRQESRLRLFESCDIRDFETTERFDIVVSDVAFISLLHILDAVDRLSTDLIILLFKPQFEVGREAKRDKRGVVLDQKAISQAMARFESACQEKGWRLQEKSPSHLTGKEGNLEYCYLFTKH